MKIHKLSLDDYLEDDYALLGIYSGLEPFQVAYQLNKNLGLRLIRTDKDLDLNFFEAAFPCFVYEDVKLHTHWSLIVNKCLTEQPFMNSSGSLFSTAGFKEEVVRFIVPEKKDTDYFLKIKGLEDLEVKACAKQIKSITNFGNVFTLNPNKIKSVNNLII